jgi:acyl-CoA reductase-like NAD-dependent aldehyde dehydrogenase
MSKLISTNPASGEVLGEVEVSTEEEIKQKVQKARDAFKSWGNLKLEERVEHLRKVIESFKQRKEDLAKIATQEMGMPITQSRSTRGFV